MKELQPIERAAVLLYLFEGEKNPVIYYNLCHNEHPHALPATVERYARAWRNSEPVQNYIAMIQGRNSAELQRGIKQGITGYKGGNNNGGATDSGAVAVDGFGGSGLVDFRDPVQMLEQLNTLANTATEERDKREYLKLIADLLRFKESDNTETGDIMRFYTPLTCSACTLYKTAKGGKG